MTSTELDQVISRIDRLDKKNEEAHQRIEDKVDPLIADKIVRDGIDKKVSSVLKRTSTLILVIGTLVYWLYLGYNWLMDSAVSPMLQKFSGK